MKIALLCTLAAIGSIVAFVAPARGALASNWYWSPGACKSELHAHGVSISDGRSYNVDQAYCVGLHNHCWLNDGLRRYKVFIAVMRSYDGVVRRFTLTATGKNTWTGSPVRILSNYMSAGQFAAEFGPAAWTVAASENAAGCFDVHP